MRNDEIGDVSGPIEIERVIDEENGRTFDRLAVEILILDGKKDGQGEKFCSECNVTFETPIPVTRQGYEAEVIGWAHPFLDGNRLMADIFIRYDSPERLLIESGEKIYPSATGIIVDKVGSTVHSFDLKGVALHLSPNSDSRIGAV